MFNSRTLSRTTIALAPLVGLALLSCDNAPPTLAPTTPNAAAMSHSTSAQALGADVNADLAALRALTAAFHNFDKAKAAGWSTQITPCLEIPIGGQGFHYGNTAFIDGTVNLLQPELLMYEPQENGQLRLVAVEYIVPLAAWTSSSPPTLLGRQFTVNADAGIWALHVWLWSHNPLGLHADWSPRVSCQAAP